MTQDAPKDGACQAPAQHFSHPRGNDFYSYNSPLHVGSLQEHSKALQVWHGVPWFGGEQGGAGFVVQLNNLGDLF